MYEWFKRVAHLWPILVTVMGLTVTAASANTRLEDLTDKVAYLYQEGSPAVAVHVAHIDEKQDMMAKQLDRMEDKLDDLDAKKDRTR